MPNDFQFLKRSVLFSGDPMFVIKSYVCPDLLTRITKNIRYKTVLQCFLLFLAINQLLVNQKVPVLGVLKIANVFF